MLFDCRNEARCIVQRVHYTDELSVASWRTPSLLESRFVASSMSLMQQRNLIQIAVRNWKLTVEFHVLALCFRTLPFFFLNLGVWLTFQSTSCRNKAINFLHPQFSSIMTEYVSTELAVLYSLGGMKLCNSSVSSKRPCHFRRWYINELGTVVTW